MGNALTNRVQYQYLTLKEKEQFTIEAKRLGYYRALQPDGTYKECKRNDFYPSGVYQLKLIEGVQYAVTPEGGGDEVIRTSKSTQEPHNKVANFCGHAIIFTKIGHIVPGIPEEFYDTESEIDWTKRSPICHHPHDGPKCYVTARSVGWTLGGWVLVGYTYKEDKMPEDLPIRTRKGKITEYCTHAVFQKKEHENHG